MTDIIAFISARLDEREQRARQAERAVGTKYDPLVFSAGETVSIPLMELYREADPAHVLAEVKAKRAILALHQISSRPEEWGDVRHHPDQDWPRSNYMGQLTGGTVYSCAICDIGVNLDADGPLWRAEEACETVRWMAAPYADHPDCNPAWRVGA